MMPTLLHNLYLAQSLQHSLALFCEEGKREKKNSGCECEICECEIYECEICECEICECEIYE